MGEPEQAPASVERIGRYEIVMQIAKGGMATVFLARAEGLGGFDRYVAVKLTSEKLKDDPEFSAHLIEEAKLVAHLRHMNVVPVLDVGECDRGVFLVMEYIPGDSLAGLLRRAREEGAPLPSRVGLRILVDAITGLHAAHEHADEEGHPLHLVHRDFSPQNILVGTDGVARLTDFGIAKAASRASNTEVGNIKGKISYVAPEQALGNEIDRRCDVWAAGVIAWELIAGKKLHGTNERALVDIVQVEPPHVRTVKPLTPEPLDACIAAVLKLDPNARTSTAAAFARELAAAAKAAGLLAETDEVAEHVARLTASTLAERKERIAQARRQRRISSPEIIVPASSPMRRMLPSLPELPISSIPILNVTDPSAQGMAPSSDFKPTLVPPSNPDPEGRPPEVIVFPLGNAGVTPPSGQPTGVLANPRVRMGVYAGAALLSVIVLVVTMVAVIGGRKDDATTLGSASASASTEVPNDVSAVKVPKVASTISADEGVWPSMLEIEADAPIASVRVEGRATEITSPTRKVSVEVDPEEVGKDLSVVATSADGRSVTAVAKNGAVSVSFANAPPALPAPPPKRGPTRPPPRRR